MTSAERVDCASLPRGSLLYVETKNRHCWIECLGGTAIRIAGHPEYCPTPAAGHVLESGLVERGKRLRFLLHDCRPVTTSRVVRVRVQRAGVLLVDPLKHSHSSTKARFPRVGAPGARAAVKAGIASSAGRERRSLAVIQ